MGFINDIISAIGKGPTYGTGSSKYNGSYVESLKAGAIKLPTSRQTGGGFENDLGGKSETLGYNLILDTDIDQTVFNKKYFNRWGKPLPDEALSNARGYVFISRPDLNIIGPSGKINSDMVDNILQSMVATHPDVLRMLSQESCPEFGAFMPIMTNTCQGYDVPDITLKTHEFGETFRGWKWTYGRHTVESRTLYSFSLAFEDNRDGTVYNISRAWVQYIESINYGVINSKEKYIRERVVDYMASVYYIVVAEDGETVLFWSKDTGVFPTSIPSSAYSMEKAGSRGALKVNIQFSAMVHEEMNPAIFTDFNTISVGNNTKQGSAVKPDYKKNIESMAYTVGTTWNEKPRVVFEKNKFKLKWNPVSKEVK
ncbi:MAG: hypothetical protein ACRC0G_07650 [Fusobacteriaceae bacterium]